MRCLLEGQVSEEVEIPLPHGMVSIKVVGANPNYTFFLKNFWKELGKEVRLRFGTCHPGDLSGGLKKPVDSALPPEAIPPSLDPLWLNRLSDFKFYTTKGNRYAVVAYFIGKDTLPHVIRMNRATYNALTESFLKELQALL